MGDRLVEGAEASHETSMESPLIDNRFDCECLIDLATKRAEYFRLLMLDGKGAINILATSGIA